MKVKKSSTSNSLKNSYKYDGNDIDDSYIYDFNNKNTVKKLKYFDIYNQIKEEMKQNTSNDKNKKNKFKKTKIIDDLYIKNTDLINNYLEGNYSIIDVEGTKELDGVEKKNLAKEVKNNQSHWRQKILGSGLQYRNPELNKKCKKLNYTPIPINIDNETMNNLQKNELDKAKHKAKYTRIMEYTHAYPPPLSEEDYLRQKQKRELIIRKRLDIINKAKIIQNWYRWIKKYRNLKKQKEKFRNKKNNNAIDIYNYWEKSIKNNYKLYNTENNYKEDIFINNNYIQKVNTFNIIGNKINYFDTSKTEYDDLYKITFLAKKPVNNNNNNKNNYIKLYPRKENSFIIINNNSFNNNIPFLNNYIDDEIVFKPMKKCCFITKSDMILLNRDEIIKIELIQNKIKIYLKNKTKRINNNKSLNINKSFHSLNTIFDNKNHIKNKSDNKSHNKYIISDLDSLQFFHNLTINKDSEILFDNLISNKRKNDNTNKNEEESFKNEKNKEVCPYYNYNLNLLKSLSNHNDSLNSNKENIFNNSSKNNSLSLEKLEITFKGQNNFKIKKIVKDFTNKNYYFEKKRYKNLEKLFLKIKDLQSKIVLFLHKKELTNNSINKGNFSSSSYSNENINSYEDENNYNINEEKQKLRNPKINNNNLVIENINNFNLDNTKNNNDKLKLLKFLVIKNNKKLNNELKNNINSYYDKKGEMKYLTGITKKKLPMKLIKIIKEYLKPIFIDIYRYNSIISKRKQALLTIFNNITSKLKYYFYIWSGMPLKLLIYKSNNPRYYHSLNILNNKIIRLIHSILNCFIKKYFYLLISRYLYDNNIDINNNHILNFLNNGGGNLKIINEIFKYNNNIEDRNNNKMNLIEFLNILEKLNNDENIDVIKNKEIKINEINHKKKNSNFKIINDIDIYKKNKVKNYTPIKTIFKQKYNKKDNKKDS